MPRLRQDEAERAEAEQRACEQSERAEADRIEKQLLRELDEEDCTIAEQRERLANLPPESSQERENRLLRERLERLEAERDGRQAVAALPQRFDRKAESRQYFRREALRILRTERANAEAEKRQQAHEAACRKELDRLEGEMDAATRALAEEEGRAAEAAAKLNTERRELNKLREAILRPPLIDGETSKDRLHAVLGERSST